MGSSWLKIQPLDGTEDNILFEGDDLDMKDAADVKLDGNNCEDEQFSCFYDDPTCKDQFFQKFFKKIKLFLFCKKSD